MSTPFTKIYEKLDIKKDDKRILYKPTNLLYQLYYSYLEEAIGLFQYDCYKDLTDLTPFQQVEYWFQSDGIDNEYVLLSPTIPIENGLFFVGYSKDENTVPTEILSNNYSYNSMTNMMTITDDRISNGDIVYVSSYIIGEFTDDLERSEIQILSEGCLIPFLEEQQNRNNLLNQKVYGQQKMYSQAEHIKQVKDVNSSQLNKVLNLITTYSYKANPNNLKGLGGNV